MPQLRASDKWGQRLPPLAGFVCTKRSLCCEDPAPHVWEHAEYDCQTPTTQSWGQSGFWHWRVSVSAEQLLPPYAAASCTLRYRVCTPAPQDREQDSQSPHGAIWQSIGQLLVLHASVFHNTPQGAPDKPKNNRTQKQEQVTLRSI